MVFRLTGDDTQIYLTKDMARGGAREGVRDRTTDSDDRRGHMDAERDTDGTTDAYEGDHTPADGAGTDGEDGKPDTGPGNRLAIIRRNPAPVRVYPRRDTDSHRGLIQLVRSDLYSRQIEPSPHFSISSSSCL